MGDAPDPNRMSHRINTPLIHSFDGGHGDPRVVVVDNRKHHLTPEPGGTTLLGV